MILILYKTFYLTKNKLSRVVLKLNQPHPSIQCSQIRLIKFIGVVHTRGTYTGKVFVYSSLLL